MTREEEIGWWGEATVERLLRRVFSGAATSRQIPDHGTDLFCSIKPKNTGFLRVEWRIQVKATTKPRRNADGLSCKVSGARIKDCWADEKSKTHWLLFFVVFNACYSELRVMSEEQLLASATVYLVDMLQAIKTMTATGHLTGVLDDRDYDLVIPTTNQATPYLLTVLWASHRWVDIQQRIGELSPEIFGVADDLHTTRAEHMWSSLHLLDQPESKLPLAILAVNSWILQRLGEHKSGVQEVVLTLQADFLEDVLACLMDSNNHIAYERFAATSESEPGAIWIIQVGMRAREGPAYERILAHQLAKFMLVSGYKVAIVPAIDSHIVPEVSVPRYGAITHGFYSPGEEFKNEKDSDSEASERRGYYLHLSHGVLLSRPSDALRRSALEAFGLENLDSRDLQLASYPLHLLPKGECECVAEALASSLVLPVDRRLRQPQ